MVKAITKSITPKLNMEIVKIKSNTDKNKINTLP